MLRTNILANLAGSAWTALLTLAVMPLQVRLLGMEAYGVIGLITVLQVMLSALDLGLAATITQRIAAGREEGRAAALDLARSALAVYLVMAALIGGGLFIASGPLARDWLNASTLPRDDLTLAFQVIALYLALRWPVAALAGLVSGLERMDLLNTVKAIVATLRLGGSVLVLLARPDLISFLTWFAFTAAVELLLFAALAWKLAPSIVTLRFSWEAVGPALKFTGAMSAIAVASILLTQLDRVVISRLLSLEALGFYTLAYSVGIGVSLLQTALNNAALPAFARAHAGGEREALTELHGKVSRLMGALVTLPCVVLLFFSHEILAVWVSPAAADGAWISMSLLSLGFYLNATSSNAYIASVAAGRPDLPLKVNLVALVLYTPALLLLVMWAGIEGAAVAWLGLNLLYMAVLPAVVHRGVLAGGAVTWLWRSTLVFLVPAVGVFAALKVASDAADSVWVTIGGLVAGCLAYGILAWRLLAPDLAGGVGGLLRIARAEPSR